MSKDKPTKDVLHVDAYGRLIRGLLLCLLVLGALTLTAVALAFCTGSSATRCLIPGVISALLVVVGLLAFDRRRIEVDRTNRSILFRECLLGWRSEQMRKLHEFQGIALVRDWNLSRRGPPKLYRIVLEPVVAGERPLELMSEFSGALAARRWLVRLSHVTGLPLRMVDATELSEKASAIRQSKRRRR